MVFKNMQKVIGYTNRWTTEFFLFWSYSVLIWLR